MWLTLMHMVERRELGKGGVRVFLKTEEGNLVQYYYIYVKKKKKNGAFQGDWLYSFQDFLPVETVDKICPMPPPSSLQGQDILALKYTSDGEFSLGSAYDSLRKL